MQDNEHVERCDAAIAADLRGGECRVIARAAAGRIRRSGWGGKGMAQQGASRLMVLAVLFAGFYIDDRRISVPGIDCYCKHA